MKCNIVHSVVDDPPGTGMTLNCFLGSRNSKSKEHNNPNINFLFFLPLFLPVLFVFSVFVFFVMPSSFPPSFFLLSLFFISFISFLLSCFRRSFLFFLSFLPCSSFHTNKLPANFHNLRKLLKFSRHTKNIKTILNLFTVAKQLHAVFKAPSVSEAGLSLEMTS